MDKELIDTFKLREKLIYDTWIEKRGISVSVEPLKLLDDATGELGQVDTNPFPTPTKFVGIDNENIITESFGTPYTTKMIFLNTSFELMDFSLEMAVNEAQGDLESDNNFDNLLCYIKGDFVAKGSIITLSEYNNIQMIVKSIKKKRQISDIFHYSLSRS